MKNKHVLILSSEDGGNWANEGGFEIADARVGDDSTERIIACLRALDGIADPKEFVAAAKDVLLEQDGGITPDGYSGKSIDRLRKAIGAERLPDAGGE